MKISGYEKLQYDQTMTVGELKEILNKFDNDIKILITYESIFISIKKEKIYKGNPKLILIDADGIENFYKKEFENKIEIGK